MDLPVTIKEVGHGEDSKERHSKIGKDGTFGFDLVPPGKWDVKIDPTEFCYKFTSQRIAIGAKNSVLDADFTMLGRKI